MSKMEFRALRMMVMAGLILAVAGCTGGQSANNASVEIKGSGSGPTTNPVPGTQSATDAQPTVNANGIVTYDGYQAAMARSGDTVASVANRIGLSASELGAYNGLAPSHPLRSGDELVLPPRPGGYETAPAASTAIEQIPLGGNTTEPTTTVPGTTTATPPAWSPDLAAAAIERATGIDDRGNLAAPPSATEPVPPAPQAPGTLASPQLGQYQTPRPEARPIEDITTPEEQPDIAINEDLTVAQVTEPAPATQLALSQPPADLQLARPVRGTVVIGFQQGAGRARNDGIDFAAPAGSAVVAAADGEVALVSQSLGGLGTIVLIRHPDEYLTVYGRIENVNVAKGDIVRRGQKIGIVTLTTEPRMHFEVRRGAESLDPERFF